MPRSSACCALLLLAMPVASAQFVADSSKVRHPAARHVMLDNSGDGKRTKEQMLESVADLMALDEAKVTSMVSRDNGFAAVRCPLCSAYVSTFSLDDPGHVFCKHCKAKFPSPDFPETHPHQGRNVSGEPVTWRCYRKDGKGYQYFFSAVLRYARHHYLADKTQDLGRLYHQTHDERYARRAAVILTALAEAYPHWCARYDHIWYGRYIVDQRPWKGGVWGRGHWHEMPVACLFAYDHVYDSPVWTELSQERNRDARKPVEDWFRSSHRMVMEMHEDAGGRFGNLHPYTIRHVVAAGLVLNDPDVVHSVVPWFAGVTGGNFFFDGMWREGTIDYHGQTVWNLDRAIRAIRGYTDPPGYVDTERGIRLEKADMKRDLPILERASEVMRTCLYPDGRRVTVHDTHWRPPSDAYTPMANIELNAYGHFALFHGDDTDGMQAHLHFCPLTKGGHYHVDRLSFSLWAAGREVLPDIGYATDRRCYRYFATGRLSHNMAYAGWAVPRKAPDRKFEPGELDTNIWARSSLLAYDPGTSSKGQVQLVEAESLCPEWEGIDAARRLILMVAIDGQRSYVFDLFRLRGGEWHEWILRPSAEEDCDQTCSLPLRPRKGTLAGPDVPYGKFTRGAGYRVLIHDLRVGDGAQACTVTWTGKKSSTHVRAFLNPCDQTELICARAPIVRPAKNTPSERDKHQGPYLIRRREGAAGLTSSLAAVYDAWRKDGSPLVDRVEWLAAEPADPFCVAAKIRIREREDLVYVSADQVPRSVDGVRVRGRVCVLSRRRGAAAWGYVFGSGEVALGDFRVEGTRDLRAAVERPKDATANALHVAGQLPEGAELAGCWARVVHGDGTAHGYRIEEVQRTDAGSTVLIRGAAGFEPTEDGMRMLFFPGYTIPGKQRLEVCVPRFLRGPGAQPVKP